MRLPPGRTGERLAQLRWQRRQYHGERDRNGIRMRGSRPEQVRRERPARQSRPAGWREPLESRGGRLRRAPHALGCGSLNCAVPARRFVPAPLRISGFGFPVPSAGAAFSSACGWLYVGLRWGYHWSAPPPLPRGAWPPASAGLVPAFAKMEGILTGMAGRRWSSRRSGIILRKTASSGSSSFASAGAPSG